MHASQATEKKLDMAAALQDMMVCGLAAADPLRCVPPVLPEAPTGRIVVVGAGKAAAKMARATELHYGGAVTGMVITRHGHSVPCDHIRVVEAGHPVPEESGLKASADMLQFTAGLGADDLLIYLASGGGSSLFEQPADGIELDDIRHLNRQMLRAGIPINEMNCVRKHISAIKGGRLAGLAGQARLVTIAISDVPTDDPSVIGSGATVPDPTTRFMALDVLTRYKLDVPSRILHFLRQPRSETPKAGHRSFERTEFAFAARPVDMIDAVTQRALDLGFKVINLGAELEGEAQILGAEHAARALDESRDRSRHSPTLIVSGGETTVAMRATDGRGGRNTQYLLSLAIGLDNHPDIWALAVDSDGIDGSEHNAGAMIAPSSLAFAAKRGLDAKLCLESCDSFSFFQAIGCLLSTGPTGTNVNDLRLIAIG